MSNKDDSEESILHWQTFNLTFPDKTVKWGLEVRLDGEPWTQYKDLVDTEEQALRLYSQLIGSLGPAYLS